MAKGRVWFIITVRAVGLTCIIMALGVVLFWSLTWFGPRVATSDRGDVVVVVVVPLPNQRGGARFLEASHGNTIIFRGNSQLRSRRGKDNLGLLVASGVLLLKKSGVSVGGHVIVWFIQEL